MEYLEYRDNTTTGRMSVQVLVLRIVQIASQYIVNTIHCRLTRNGGDEERDRSSWPHY